MAQVQSSRSSPARAPSGVHSHSQLSQPGSKHRKLGQQENVCWAWLAGLSRETVDAIDLAKSYTDLLGVLPETLV